MNTPSKPNRCRPGIAALSLALGLGAAWGAYAATPAVESAIATGDASLVSDSNDLIAAGLETIQASGNAGLALKAQLYNLNPDGTPKGDASSLTSIKWDPSWDSALWTVGDQENSFDVMTTNYSFRVPATAVRKEPLVVAGTVAGSPSTRFMVFGANPFHDVQRTVGDDRTNAQFRQWLVNAVGWATNQADLSTAPLKVVTAHLPNTTYFQWDNNSNNWFTSRFPGFTLNAVNACDNAALSGCLFDSGGNKKVDLLVIAQDPAAAGQEDAVVNAVANAIAQGIPVIYLNNDGAMNTLGSRLIGLMNVQYLRDNYWNEEGQNAYNITASPMGLSATLSGYQDLLTRFRDNTFTMNWTGCTTTVGKVNCDADANFSAQFNTTATGLKNQLNGWDVAGYKLFDNPRYRLQKILVLLGDKYRQAIAYPMDKATTPTKTYLSALFADNAVYYNRPQVFRAPGLGTFASEIPNSETVYNPTVSANTGPEDRETTTGYYLKPGQTVTITRTDSGTATAYAAFNLVRDSTRRFNANGYTRPAFLGSPRFKLVPGQTLTLSSPYGGPLYITTPPLAGAPQTVTANVTNVVGYPALLNPDDPVAKSDFQTFLGVSPASWVTLATDVLQVHSKKDKFIQAYNPGDPAYHLYNGDLNLFLDHIWTYMVKDTYELAGFSGAGLTLPATVQQFCNDFGWVCANNPALNNAPWHAKPRTQQVIVDNNAYCGSGCSGNPYDQDWALLPLGWGESHEIGHNRQRDRLKIYAGKSTEVSNNIFPAHKSIHRNRDLGYNKISRGGTANDNLTAFGWLDAGQSQPDPATYVYNLLWSQTGIYDNAGTRLQFYEQLPFYAKQYGRPGYYSDGWEVFTLLYILERNFTEAAKTDAAWTAQKTGMGFGSYARTDASAMNGNDFMLIASSYVLGLDMRDFFTMWGITYSTAAANQVVSFGFPMGPKSYYRMDDYMNQTSGAKLVGCGWADGNNDGVGDTCDPPSVGQCGTAHGVLTYAAPTANLCAAGATQSVATATAVDKYTWACQNVSNPALFSSCSAPRSYFASGIIGTNGTASPSNTLYIQYGLTGTFTITPKTGYAISAITGCNGTRSGNQYTTGPMAANCNFSVSYVAAK